MSNQSCRGVLLPVVLLMAGQCVLVADPAHRPGLDERAASEDSATNGKVETDAKLSAAILPLIKRHSGDVSVAVRHLESDIRFFHQADKAMPTASLIKLPLMVTTYQLAADDVVDLDQAIVLKSSDKVPGSGILRDHLSAGIQISLRDYVRLMIRYSDNTATNVVIDQVKLPTTTKHMKALDLLNTQLHSKVYRGDTSIAPERSREFGLGSTTASEMVELLAMLHAGDLGDEASTQEMLDHLRSCDDRTKIPRFLDRSIEVAHKTGAVSNCRTDAGILFTTSGPVAVCVLTNKNEDRSWADDNAAEILCGKIGLAVANRFGAKKKAGPLQSGATGRLVESLQRTLNARLDPSPGLAVDGDFGPATRAAVERFQRENRLDATGIVQAKTWSALGTLIERDDPVPPPDVVNNEKLDLSKEPSLDGPPIVTCKAWVIGDTDGHVLWNKDGDRPLAAASTTKIMTAHVVLKMADENPNILDEIITFSQTADETIGSTTGLRAGEQIDVKTLLYGLLLPSGNDASIAFAEHFGEKLRKSPDENPVEAFIAEMNREASRLGLKTATYKNPHGLSHPEHLISAADLLRLASIAMQNPRFREIVGTRQFGCQVTSTTGYTRNVRWKNTNRLLGIEGYSGVKTGTTSAAGACLVSLGQRDDVTRMVVVLGSQSSTARYADSRNLYRWAWSQKSESEAKNAD